MKTFQDLSHLTNLKSPNSLNDFTVLSKCNTLPVVVMQLSQLTNGLQGMKALVKHVSLKLPRICKHTSTLGDVIFL